MNTPPRVYKAIVILGCLAYIVLMRNVTACVISAACLLFATMGGAAYEVHKTCNVAIRNRGGKMVLYFTLTSIITTLIAITIDRHHWEAAWIAVAIPPIITWAATQWTMVGYYDAPPDSDMVQSH